MTTIEKQFTTDGPVFVLTSTSRIYRFTASRAVAAGLFSKPTEFTARMQRLGFDITDRQNFQDHGIVRAWKYGEKSQPVKPR